MNLRQLIQSVAVESVHGSLDIEVRGLAYDSRRVTPGMVFVALEGQQVDGHEYISDAIERGAIAVICRHDGYVSPRATTVVVSDPRQVLAHASAAFYQHPASRLKMVGVTGTNGKTTVSFVVAEILREAGVQTGLIGTIRYEIGDRMIPATRTTPESLEIQQMLSQMLKAGCGACVMEVSSHAIEQQRILEIEFDATIFTNLSQDHLDYHGSMDNYFAAKTKLFTAMRHGVKKMAAVINIDDPYGRRLSEREELSLRLNYGLGEAAELRGFGLELSAGGSRFQVDYRGRRFACETPLIGRHNVYNALAAIGAALMLDIEPTAIQMALKRMPPVPGRLERITEEETFSVFVDYAHTEDALRHSLSTLREFTEGRLLVVFGCGGTRDTGKRAAMGRVAAGLADFTVITSDNPRREEPSHIAAMIREGYEEVRGDRYEIELDRRRAIERIIQLAGAGDTVLIAGKGHETYQEFDGAVIPFDDRLVAREALSAIRKRTSKTGRLNLESLMV